MGDFGMWLGTLGYALPELLGMGIALALLLTSARPGHGRRIGLIGLGAMIVAAMLSIALVIVQNLAVRNADGGGLSQAFAFFSMAHVVLNVLSMGGLVTLVWGLCVQTQSGERREPRP